MKTRPEWWFYAFLIFSIGFFAFVWVIVLMRDINRLEGRSVFPIRVLGGAFAVGLVLHLVALFFPEVLGVGIYCLMATGALLVGSLFVSVILVYWRAKQLVGVEFGISDVLAAIGLTLLLFLSFILVQQAVNAAIGKRTQLASH